MSNLLNKFADKLHGNDHDERYEDDNDDQTRQQRHENINRGNSGIKDPRPIPTAKKTKGISLNASSHSLI